MGLGGRRPDPGLRVPDFAGGGPGRRTGHRLITRAGVQGDHQRG
jgi:hypothetical protein